MAEKNNVNERCTVCRCSEFEPCEPPCSWVVPNLSVCSSCYELAICLRQWHDEVAYKASFAALIRLAKELRDTSVRPLVSKPARGSKNKTAGLARRSR